MTYLRFIQENDLEMVMHWRMMPEITRYMYTDPVLTLEEQKRWFCNLLNDNTKMVFIIIVDDIPAGVLDICDIDYVNRRCSWGYYIAVKKKRSLYLAMALEWNLYDYVFEVLGFHKLEGEIFSFNKNVLRIHQMCGSEIEGVRKQHIYKNGEYYDVTYTGIIREAWMKIREKYNYDNIEFEKM